MCDERLRLLSASSQEGGRKNKKKEKKLASKAKPAEVGVLLLRFVSVCHRFESTWRNPDDHTIV